MGSRSCGLNAFGSGQQAPGRVIKKLCTAVIREAGHRTGSGES
ncbi:MAG TPA: hypothetical protein PLA91_01980 [Bacillota bacterium]|nr:hypothetical protein [Bacillota bacterium]